MRHWVGRIDLPSRNITAIKEFDSEEDCIEFIHNKNVENEEVNQYNSQLKIAKRNLPIIVPDFDKEIHKSLTQYIKLKKKIKREIVETLSEEEQKTYSNLYKISPVPHGTKLVYMKIYEIGD